MTIIKTIKAKLASTAIVLTSLVCFATYGHAQSNNPEQDTAIVPMIHVVEQALPEFLRQAARRNGYQVTMTSRVRGTLKKISLPLDLEELLQKIAPQFDLKWHFQENQLYVSVGSENSTRLIFLGNTKMLDLEKALTGAGLKSKNYNLTYVEDSNSVIVNGPVSYIASVELLAESLSKNKQIQKDKLKIIRFGNVSKQ